MATADKTGSLAIEGKKNDEVLVKEEPSFVVRTAPKWVLGVAALLLFLSGSFDSLISKVMNRQKLPPCSGDEDQCEPRFFESPIFQTVTMYIGGELTTFVNCLLLFSSRIALSYCFLSR